MTADPLELELENLSSVTVRLEEWNKRPTVGLTAATGYDYEGVDLTPLEARTVARALLAHADAIDPPPPACRACRDGLPHRHA